MECYEVTPLPPPPHQKTSNICFLLVLNATRVASKTLEGAVRDDGDVDRHSI